MKISRLRARPHILGGLIAAAAIGLAGCPQPNGYTTTAAFPQASFGEMLGMHWLPNDPSHALVLTKPGVIWRISTVSGTEPPTTFLDLRDRMIPRPANEEGLLGLAFAPDFATSGRFFVHYTALGDYPVRDFDNQARKVRISRFSASGMTADPSSERILLEIRKPQSNHNGGALAFGPDGYLYVALGDGGGAGDPNANGQSLSSHLGKILRLDVSGDAYTIPADNPFVAVPDALGEIWAYGLRNPWRIAFDPATGVLWVGDVGQTQIEEINIIVRGKNYGWNRLEGSSCFADSPCDATGTTAPVAEYSHEFGCAITGGYVYHGTDMPELQGWYVFGDFCTGRVWGIDGGRDGVRPIIPLADTALSISSFAQGPSGEIYLVTLDGTIRQLARQ